MALTQAQLAEMFAKWRADPNNHQNGWENANPAGTSYIDPTGLGGVRYTGNGQEGGHTGFMPIYEFGHPDGQDGYTGDKLIGYRDNAVTPKGDDKSILNGTKYTNYNLDGSVKDTGTWEGLTKGNALGDYLNAVAFLATAYLGGSAAFGGGAFGAGAGALGAGVNPVMGAGATGALGGGGIGAVGGAGGFIGEGVASGVPAWDAAAAAALPGEAVAGGAGAYTTAAGDSQLANVGIQSSGGNPALGYTGTGGVTASPIGAGATQGLSTTQLLNGAKTGAGLLSQGGGGGGGGGDGSSTSTRTMDPRMDPYVYGDDNQRGILQYASGLLAQQMTPERLAEGDKIRNIGMGLLQQPIAGNGFQQFSNRRF